jgi:parallel beta-helix repeat protein
MPVTLTKLQVRRGLKVNLPVLDVGELGFTTDTEETFIGTSKGNKLIGAGEQSVTLGTSKPPAGLWFKVIGSSELVPEFTDKYLLNDLSNVPDGGLRLKKLNQDVLDYIGANGGGSGGSGGGSSTGTAVNEYSTPEKFGAKGDGIADDTSAIQQAIEDKLEVRLTGEHYKISDALYTKDGTKLIFGSNTVIERTNDKKFIMNSNPASGVKGAGYNKGKLTVLGGIFKNSSATNTLLSIAHGDGIKFEGCTFLNTIDSHTIDLGGCRNVVIRDCKFLGYKVSATGELFREAIQIDLATIFGMPDSYSVFDSTPCKNVLIENNYFGPNPDGGVDFNRGHQVAVGTHTQVIGIKSKNITIRNNVIEDVRYYGFDIMGWDNVLIENNIIQSSNLANYGIFARVTDTPYGLDGVKLATADPTKATSFGNIQIRGNRITGMLKNGIRINSLANTAIGLTEKTKVASASSGNDNMKVTDILIDGNIVESCGEEGIYVTDGLNATIEKNKVRTCLGDGIYCAFVRDLIVTRNDVFSVGLSNVSNVGRGIYVVYSDRLVVSDNKVLSSAHDSIGLVWCTSAVIGGNNCDTSGNGGVGCGVYVRNTDGLNIANNLILNTKNHGIDVRIISKNGVVQGNTINRCGTGGGASNYGIYINDNTDGIDVTNNRIYTATGDTLKYGVYATSSCKRTRTFNNTVNGSNIKPVVLATPAGGAADGPTYDGLVITKADGTETYNVVLNATGQLVLTPMVTTTNPAITFTGV